MKSRLFLLFLLATIIFSGFGLSGCSLPFFGPDEASEPAGFQLIDLVENADDIFTIASNSVLLAQDAIQLVETIKASDNPPTDTKSGHVTVSILYNKRGVESQDIYSIFTGKASLGIFLQGGETFESFTASTIDIDATNTKQISLVPLQDATTNFTVSATKGWQDTRIFLKRGRPFDVRYLSGIWTVSKGIVNTSDAAGQPANPPPDLICHCGEPLAGYSTQALIGRIGSGVGFTPLQIGDDFSGVAYDNEFLYLRINLPDQLLAYGNGTVKVSIQTNNS